MRLSPRRELSVAVVTCAAAAALVLVAAGRTWAVEVTLRPAPLPDLRSAHSGGDLYPWLPALAWVSLASPGALLATRAALRRLVGGLQLLAGAGILAAAVAGAAGAAGTGVTGTGVAGTGVAAGWSVLVATGGLAVALVGGLTAARSSRWPAMGARYERRDRAAVRQQAGGDRPEQLWAALDRGEDPTVR